ncbi:MAG: GMP/IMP nucleotidase [Gammaproteobacteria bacterium]|nr:GMP/IMP nucleotidase [Rhodocyclaceae bacterium]MBU3910080.1 GMP/IMP nucleotidase [Gammaproteobacteria bacterium]MBU3989421.1 GMP/IMP nucleotidase [Gammaproteobacteria bacterium]MBU4003907.1 GMP/IMP nucleotidase [Gammaproteobacteria bacterium]MBU4022542.1 GMP/IMP nucleotidase [Gammaproteobacteria bacterium]
MSPPVRDATVLRPCLDWHTIDTVLLDMDGTLLDLHFDNHFWQAHVPLRYAEARGLPLDVAREELMARYHARAGTLEWYSVDFWETELELDIMRLKEEVAHLIAVHPAVTDFLTAMRTAGKRLVLATNAHHKALTLKMARTGLEPHFDALVSSHTLGAAKEAQAFWERLRAVENFDPARTLLVDDSLPVLDAARSYGIRHLVAVRRPDTRQPEKNTADYPAIDSFAELLA